MTKLRIVAAAPVLVLGLSISPAQAGFGLNAPLLLPRNETAIARATKAPALGTVMPGIVPVDDMMGMQPQQQQPAPAPPSLSAAPGSMQPSGMMMDDKMAMPPSQPMPNASSNGAAPPMSMPSSGPSAVAGGMPNMGMAQMMMAMQTMMRGQSSDPLDHFEGRIAFLKAELGITDAQTQAWDQFAQALRSDRQHLLEARQALSISTGQSDTLNRLAAYEQHLSMRLDALRAARAAFVRLYGMLSDTQKRTADELALPFLEAF